MNLNTPEQIARRIALAAPFEAVQKFWRAKSPAARMVANNAFYLRGPAAAGAVG